jgi:hypothetical protein
MPEKVTPLNGLKVTSEYCSYKTSVHNKDYVKRFLLQFIKLHLNRCPLTISIPTVVI